MHRLLDRATQLTDFGRETPCPKPLTCEAALKDDRAGGDPSVCL